MRMFKAIVVLLNALFFIVFAGSALADLQLRNDPVFGNGVITYDTGTNLEWLHINLTGTRSYNDMTGFDGTNEFATGGAFAGFRYATMSEVGQLWVHAGIPESVFFYGLDSSGHNIGTYETYDTGIFNTVRGFQESFGYELAEAYPPRIQPGGWTTEGLALDSTDIGFPSLRTCTPGTGFCGGSSSGVARVYLGGVIPDYWEPLIGYHHWLVRDISSVPEPTTMLLLGLGLVGLAGIRRKL